MIFTGVQMNTRQLLSWENGKGTQEEPAESTPKQVPQYGPDWVAFALAGGTIVNGNTLMVPPEETIND